MILLLDIRLNPIALCPTRVPKPRSLPRRLAATPPTRHSIKTSYNQNKQMQTGFKIGFSTTDTVTKNKNLRNVSKGKEREGENFN